MLLKIQVDFSTFLIAPISIHAGKFSPSLDSFERKANAKGFLFVALLESGVQFVFIFFVPKCFKVELNLYLQVLLRYFDFK